MNYFKTLFICILLLKTPFLAAQTFVKPDVKCGIDNLIDTNFELLKGKKIALLTNQAGRLKNLTSTLDAFKNTKECVLKAVLVPEHGYNGSVPAGEKVESFLDSTSNIPVFSLYGSNRRPLRSMLTDCNAVVVDLQDIGVRSYTFISTLFHTMDACAEYGIPIYVLDRPNPLGGEIVDGSVLKPEFTSFVGIAPIPYIHGMTIGELAKMFNEEGLLKDKNGTARKCKLTVVKLKRWQRTMSWDETGLTWMPTSPHIPNADAVRGIAITGWTGELSMLNTGVGTTLPFRYYGMPGFKTQDFLRELDSAFTNPQLVPVKFRPLYGRFSGKECSGVLMFFKEGEPVQPYAVGMEMFIALRRVHPELFVVEKITKDQQQMFNKVVGTDELFKALFEDSTDDEIRTISQQGIEEFLKVRKKYLLYE
ncbi:MAG: DUF1343 domain-containing protein [Bacteroidota bacterium]